MSRQSMCHIAATGKRRTGNSDAQTARRVWAVLEQLFDHNHRFFVSVQEKEGVRHRRPPGGWVTARIEPLCTTEVLQRNVRMTQPHVDPAACCPCGGEVGI